MKKLLFLLLIVAAAYFSKPELFMFSEKGAFDSDDNPQVWLFTFDDCGKPCDSIASMLDKRVEYTEFNAYDEIGKQYLQKVGGSQGFPLTVIGKQKVLGSDTMKILSTLAEVIGSDTLTSSEQSVMTGHFYEDDTPAIVMYGASWCGYCKKMRNYFEENGIDYTELDAENEAKDAFATLKGNGFPLIYIGYRRISGANIKQVEQIINEYNI